MTTTEHYIILAFVSEHILSIQLTKDNYINPAELMDDYPTLKKLQLDIPDSGEEYDYIDSAYMVPKDQIMLIWKQSWDNFTSIFPGEGDDSFFDYVPNYWDQIVQLTWLMEQSHREKCQEQMNKFIQDFGQLDDTDPGSWEEVQEMYTTRQEAYMGLEAQTHMLKWFNYSFKVKQLED